MKSLKTSLFAAGILGLALTAAGCSSNHAAGDSAKPSHSPLSFYLVILLRKLVQLGQR